MEKEPNATFIIRPMPEKIQQSNNCGASRNFASKDILKSHLICYITGLQSLYSARVKLQPSFSLSETF